MYVKCCWVQFSLELSQKVPRHEIIQRGWPITLTLLMPGTKIQDGHWQRNVNFVRELSSRAHFKDSFMLIKNWIGTIPLKFIVSLLQGGSYYKTKTSNLRGIVPIQFLISLRLSIEWPQDETYPPKLIFLFIYFS